MELYLFLITINVAVMQLHLNEIAKSLKKLEKLYELNLLRKEDKK